MENLGLISETFNYDSLIAGHQILISSGIILEQGQNLTRGAVLGKIAATGKYILSVAAASDGSEVPLAVLAKDTDATLEDQKTVVYEAGELNENALILGAGHTPDSIRFALRDLGIYLKKSIA